MLFPKTCRRLSVYVLLVLGLASYGAGEEIWIAPTFPAGVNATSFVWPVTGSGFAFFTFGVPDDLESFDSAAIVLLPASSSPGAETYQVFVEVKRGGEVVSSADWSIDNNAAATVQDRLQEIDISSQLAAELDTSSAGSDLVSLFFWFPGPGTASTEGRVVGMRFKYDALHVPDDGSVGTNQLASDAVTSDKVADGTLSSADTDVSSIQSRVGDTCPAGSSIRAIASNGTVTCETDDDSGGDITTVIAGSGLTGGGAAGAVTLAANTNFLQRRLVGTCGPGNSIREVSATGTVTCEVDSIGLSLYLHAGLQTTCGGLSACERTVTCPGGRVVMGGGVDVIEGLGTARLVKMFKSYPSNTTQWTVGVENGNLGTVNLLVYATCSATGVGSS